MSQSRRMSFAESLADLAVAAAIAVPVNYALLYHHGLTLTDAAVYTGSFVSFSLIVGIPRRYLVRRLFEWFGRKGWTL